MDLAQFLLNIHTLGRYHHASCTSWFRSELRNKAVGGVPTSLHLYGLAVDLVFDTSIDRDAFCKEAVAKGFHIYPETTHVHVQSEPMKGPLPPPT